MILPQIRKYTITVSSVNNHKGMFSGDGGTVFYSLNTTGHGRPTLLMYLESDWQQILTDPEITCEKKLSMASITRKVFFLCH